MSWTITISLCLKWAPDLDLVLLLVEMTCGSLVPNGFLS